MYDDIKSFFDPLTDLKSISLIIALGAIVYFFGLFNGFVGDDYPLLVDNVYVQSINNIPGFFTGGEYEGSTGILGNSLYRPIQNIAYSILHAVVGLNSFAFHLLVTTIAISNVCILYFIIGKFFRKEIALLLSILFLLHPVNSDSYLYISNLNNTLFFFFGSLAFYIVINYQSARSIVLASVLFLASLLSKETGAMFILITLIYLAIFRRKDYISMLVYLVLVPSIYLILRVSAISFYPKVMPNAPMLGLELSSRLINVPAILYFYLESILFPIKLSSSYQWTVNSIGFHSFYLPFMLSILLLSLVVIFGIFIFKKYRKKYFLFYIFFAVWFMLGLALHLQIYPLNQTVALRYLYFPLVGLLGLIGIFLDLKWTKYKKIFILIIVSLITVYAIRDLIRIFDWKNELTLVTQDIKVTENNFELERRMAISLMREGRNEEALEYAQKAVNNYPYLQTYTTLGTAYFNNRYYLKSKDAYLKALTYGNYYLVHNQLALLAVVIENDPKLNSDFIRESIKQFPNNYVLWLYLAVYEYEHGNIGDARSSIANAKILSDNLPIVVDGYNKIMNGEPLNLEFEPEKEVQK